ncbi:uncharacterized protein LOC129597990 [Paramacrobiotus metropolitanus]|uniref:uncharacterized protein LOC129597990 n=1 Tax=Paramacrobiotus metropolitanus TaxID=2943436 RepID=UPI0024456A06|nr:uncharacterized protein LOC129597990 [Paramacrobiotus metropolitanus]
MATNLLNRGAFIVLEGLDRSGKTTLAYLLVKELEQRQIPVEFMRFPDRSKDNVIGDTLNKYLSSGIELNPETSHMLFTTQRFAVKDQMLQKLMEGKVLIVDRYAHSGIAYSVAKGLSLEWCKAKESGLLRPDIVLYLDLLPSEGLKRGNYGEERFETVQFQEKVHNAYDQLLDDSWKILSAHDTPETLVRSALSNILRACELNAHKPVELLYQSGRLDEKSPLKERQPFRTNVLSSQ